jgi:SAM-dependent methyltransferase
VGIVIDIGCGDRKYPNSIGLDIAAFDGVDIVADVEHGLPFRDASVDGVHASHVLEHFDDLVGAMEEIWRVCRPGARVYITVPHASSSFQAWRDPTHRRALTLDTFSYFDRASPEGSRFGYYTRAHFRRVYGRLRFAGGPPRGRSFRSPLVAIFVEGLEAAANGSARAQRLCERWWGSWFGIAEAYAVLEAVK